MIEEKLGWIPAFAGMTGVTMTSTLRHSGQAQREPESNAVRRQGSAFAATKAWFPPGFTGLVAAGITFAE